MGASLDDDYTGWRSNPHIHAHTQKGGRLHRRQVPERGLRRRALLRFGFFGPGLPVDPPAGNESLLVLLQTFDLKND